MKKLKKLKKKELIKYIHEIRPRADAYDRVCDRLGIESNILKYIDNLPSPDDIQNNWIKFDKDNKPKPNEDVLLIIDRKRLGNEPLIRERHVGYRTVKDLWIIGNNFGYDMGEILYYQYMDEIPKDQKNDNSISISCENCKHETPRHSILCQSCKRFNHFEPK